jgi:hypothetical protein
MSTVSLINNSQSPALGRGWDLLVEFCGGDVRKAPKDTGWSMTNLSGNPDPGERCECDLPETMQNVSTFPPAPGEPVTRWRLRIKDEPGFLFESVSGRPVPAGEKTVGVVPGDVIVIATDVACRSPTRS